MKFVFRISGRTKFWYPVKDTDIVSPSSIAVRMENVFAFHYWYCELCLENQWGGGRKHRFVNFCSLAVLELSVDEGWWGGGRKCYLGRVEIGSFSSRDFSRRNKHDTFGHVSTGYFCVLFLWTIAVSDFCPLEIYKKIDLPLSTISFTVKSHADNHFCKYLFVSNIIQCDCNWTRTHNHLVRKRTLNHLAKLGQFGQMVECSFTN